MSASEITTASRPTAEETRAWGASWHHTTLAAPLGDAARRTPSKPAVIDVRANVTITFEQLDRLSSNVMTRLWDLGVRPGDVVSAQLPNTWQFVVLYGAVLKIGAIVNPLLPDYRESELVHDLSVAGTRVLVVPDSYRGHDHLAMTERVLAEVPGIEHTFAVSLSGNALPSPWRDFTELLADAAEPYPPVRVDPDAVSMLLFTSGSEAKPKAVVHTHNTGDHQLPVVTQDLWGLTADDVVLVAAPVGHGAGFHWCLRVGLFLGATSVLLDLWDPAVALRAIAEHACTYTYAPTRFLQDLVYAARDASPPVRLPVFASGGAPIPRILVEEARRVLDCQVLATYGQTETFLATANRPSDPIEKISGSDGRVLPGAELRLLDERGAEVPVGEPGECVTRGPGVALGYLGNPEATARAFRDGWLHTGDLCVMDADGYIRVTGRLKEIIIRNGINISPVEVEDHLMRLDGVREAAVIGLPSEEVGERVCAVVTLEAGVHWSLAGIRQAFQDKKVARYKFPEVLKVVSGIPRSSVGKTQRNILRDGIVSGTIPVLAEDDQVRPPT